MRASIVAFVCLAALPLGAQPLPAIDAIAGQADGCVITPFVVLVPPAGDGSRTPRAVGVPPA